MDMSDLKEFTVTAKDKAGKTVETTVVPSPNKDFNWESKIGLGLYRFKTKKSARENIKEIISNE